MNDSEMEFGAVESGISIVGLFLDADPVVKVVLIILMIASIWSWAVIVAKTLGLSKAKKQARKIEDQFWADGSSSSESSERNAIQQILASVSVEWTEIRKVKNSSAAITLLDRARTVNEDNGRPRDRIPIWWTRCSGLSGFCLPIYRLIWNRLGNNECIHSDWCTTRHVISNRCWSNRRGSIRYWTRTSGRNSRGNFLQQVFRRPRKLCRPIR